jgi:hypothetical protein
MAGQRAALPSQCALISKELAWSQSNNGLIRPVALSPDLDLTFDNHVVLAL